MLQLGIKLVIIACLFAVIWVWNQIAPWMLVKIFKSRNEATIIKYVQYFYWFGFAFFAIVILTNDLSKFYGPPYKLSRMVPTVCAQRPATIASAFFGCPRA